MPSSPNEAERWLDDFVAFWRSRGRFWMLAFNTDDKGQLLDDRDEYRVNPVDARRLWHQAVTEMGGGWLSQLGVLGEPRCCDSSSARFPTGSSGHFDVSISNRCE